MVVRIRDRSRFVLLTEAKGEDIRQSPRRIIHDVKLANLKKDEEVPRSDPEGLADGLLKRQKGSSIQKPKNTSYWPDS